MIDLALTTVERQEWLERLGQSVSARHRRIRVTIYDRNEDPQWQVRGKLLDGSQVDVNASQTPTHKLNLHLLDPDEEVPYDLALRHGVSLKTFVSVTWGLWLPEASRWVDAPVFFGPVRRYSRSGPEITIEADGKEHLATGRHTLGRRLSFGENMRVALAIRRILEAKGERRFRFDAPKARLDDQLVLGPGSDPWAEAQRLAREVNRQLFYDGAGFLRLRRIPSTPVFHFARGEGGTLLTPVDLTHDDSEFANVIRVTWEGADHIVEPEPNHPLSKESLKRKGESRPVLEEISVRTKKRKVAERRGKAELRRRLAIETAASFDSLPVPLEPRDRASAETPEGRTVGFRVDEFTFPLEAAEMAMGYRKAIRRTPRRYRVRRKKRKKRKR